MSTLSFYIDSVNIFKSEIKKIANDIIIDYIFQLITPNNQNIIIDNTIYEAIKSILSENDKETKEYNNGKFSNYFF